jgi:hypothetical protein
MMKIDSDEPYGKRVYFIVSGINGNIVSSGIINAGIENSIDISSQAPGIYIIKLKSGGSERIIRYVKLK